MKYTAPLLFLMTLGLVKGQGLKAEAKTEDLKTEAKAGKFVDWKTVVEKAKKVSEDKQKALTDLTAKLEAEAKARVEVELAKVTTAIGLLNTEAKKVTDLEESEFKKAKDAKEKDAVAHKAAGFGQTLVGKFLDFEAAYKKAAMTYNKEVGDKEGYAKILAFLKGKVENFEKDGFFTSSLLAAAVLSVLAVGSTFN